MKPYLASIAFISALFFLAPAVEATPCGRELADLCASEAETPAEFLDCARARDAELSEPCRSQLGRAREALGKGRRHGLRALREACSSDVARFCAAAPKKRKAVFQCLRQHRSQVSEACRESALALRATRKQGRASEAAKGVSESRPPADGRSNEASVRE